MLLKRDPAVKITYDVGLQDGEAVLSGNTAYTSAGKVSGRQLKSWDSKNSAR